MALFKRKPKELTDSEKLELLKKQKISYSNAVSDSRRVIKGYEATIQKCLKSIKENPSNKFLINNLKAVMILNLSKIKKLEKYINLIQCVELVMETKITEASLTGGSVINLSLIQDAEKVLDGFSNGIQMITESTQIDQLEQSFNIFSDMTDSCVDEDINEMLNNLLGEEVTVKKTTTASNKNSTEIDELLSQID